MTGIKRNAVVLSLSAAFILAGSLGAFAAPINGSAPNIVSQTGEKAGNGVTEKVGNGVTLVRKGRGGDGWRGHRGGNFRGFNRGKKFGGFRNRGGKFRHFRNHRRHNRDLFIAPFLAAPFLYGGYYGYDSYYGDDGYYDDSSSCYRECRYEHGRSYCRRHWRRYC